jgi:hypothetical protein
VDQTERDAEDKFYTIVEKAKIPLQTLDMLKQSHPEQVGRYLDAHKNEIITGKIGVSMIERLGKINTLQRTIQDSNTMEPDFKITSLKNLHALKMQMLNVYNGLLANVAK